MVEKRQQFIFKVPFFNVQERERVLYFGMPNQRKSRSMCFGSLLDTPLCPNNSIHATGSKMDQAVYILVG